MPVELNKNFVKKAIKDTSSDFLNGVLYKMCRDNPLHKEHGVIMGKVLIIGRTYAAAIERRRKKNQRGRLRGDFYKDCVVPKIRESKIDKWLRGLDKNPSHHRALETHKLVMRLFRRISKQENRSLASKYLHFHLPGRFYLHDSRARKAISKHKLRVHVPRSRKCDRVYARFYLQCEKLNQGIASYFRRLTPRELDKVLLAWDAKKRSSR